MCNESTMPGLSLAFRKAISPDSIIKSPIPFSHKSPNFTRDVAITGILILAYPGKFTVCRIADISSVVHIAFCRPCLLQLFDVICNPENKSVAAGSAAKRGEQYPLIRLRFIKNMRQHKH